MAILNWMLRLNLSMISLVGQLRKSLRNCLRIPGMYRVLRCTCVECVPSTCGNHVTSFIHRINEPKTMVSRKSVIEFSMYCSAQTFYDSWILKVPRTNDSITGYHVIQTLHPNLSSSINKSYYRQLSLRKGLSRFVPNNVALPPAY